uniref:Uncharacterized protein n=1 Tax=Anguilla anguilla TaxID=7936 RepID=A0A0E9WMC2_ANGAN
MCCHIVGCMMCPLLVGHKMCPRHVSCIASPTVSDITERSLPRRDKTHRCVFVNEVVMETPIPSSSKDIQQPGMRCEIIQPWPCMVEPLMSVHISLCAGICCILGLFG